MPPSNETEGPFTPVEFVGLTALAYVQQQGDFTRVALSFRAKDMVAPGKAPVRRPAEAASSTQGNPTKAA